MTKISKALFLLTLSYFIYGCASKDNEFDKPAMYWYEEIFKEIRYGNLESADTRFSSLQSEHMNSPLIPDAMLVLGHAHMREGEFLLAEFYFDEYLKRYGTQRDFDYINYLKLLSRFYAFKNQSKDQDFMRNSINSSRNFTSSYKDSPFFPFANYIGIKLKLGNIELNNAIANVYQKEDKFQAQKNYLNRSDLTLKNTFRVIPSEVPWYIKEAMMQKRIDYIEPSYIPWYVMIFDW